MIKVSCIIPAHNEESRIGDVLQVVYKHPLVDEIIVVDDASIDNTRSIVKKFPDVRLISNKENKGKSYSVATGIMESSGGYILMLDADLRNLRPEDIASLVSPVIEGRADVSMSIRKNAPVWMKLIKVDLMTGERVFPKSMVFPRIQEMMVLHSYALEVFLNRIVIKNKYTINPVFLKNVYDELKTTKKGFFAGIKLFITMWRDILKTVSFWEWLYQNFALAKLVIKEQ